MWYLDDVLPVFPIVSKSLKNFIYTLYKPNNLDLLSATRTSSDSNTASRIISTCLARSSTIFSHVEFLSLPVNMKLLEKQGLQSKLFNSLERVKILSYNCSLTINSSALKEYFQNEKLCQSIKLLDISYDYDTCGDTFDACSSLKQKLPHLHLFLLAKNPNLQVISYGHIFKANLRGIRFASTPITKNPTLESQFLSQLQFLLKLGLPVARLGALHENFLKIALERRFTTVSRFLIHKCGLNVKQFDHNPDDSNFFF